MSRCDDRTSDECDASLARCWNSSPGPSLHSTVVGGSVTAGRHSRGGITSLAGDGPGGRFSPPGASTRGDHDGGLSGRSAYIGRRDGRSVHAAGPSPVTHRTLRRGAATLRGSGSSRATRQIAVMGPGDAASVSAGYAETVTCSVEPPVPRGVAHRSRPRRATGGKPACSSPSNGTAPCVTSRARDTSAPSVAAVTVWDATQGVSHSVLCGRLLDAQPDS